MIQRLAILFLLQIDKLTEKAIPIGGAFDSVKRAMADPLGGMSLLTALVAFCNRLLKSS
jgi:multisubunit Na+/H+ antiporter MnhC subunit